MVNLAILDTLASDWTRQTWTQRLRACAETLYIHDCIDFDAYNNALDRLDAAVTAARTSRERGAGPLPQAGVEGHSAIDFTPTPLRAPAQSSARQIHRPSHGGYQDHLRRNLTSPDVLEADKAFSRQLLAGQRP